MPETRELRSVVDAGEQAAAAGDYASAEGLLREAALLQEADLGPLHPDLANTLNNLGVVCEITDKPADAELCYRRAYALATAALEPDHPFVATSRKNLRDFCEARGRPVDSPAPPPADTAERKPPAVSSVHLPHERPSHGESRLFAFGRPSLPVAIGALSACGLVFLMLIATGPWFRSNGRAGSPPGRATLLPGRSAPTREPLPVEPTRVPRKTKTTTNHSGPTAAAAIPALATVADAHLCRGLSRGGPRGDWECNRPSLPVGPGSLFFYTRLRFADDTTVQHRWYLGDQLRKAAVLPIRANLIGGYRTYSRNVVDSRSAGNWRVELRTKDGILLHEERFVVR